MYHLYIMLNKKDYWSEEIDFNNNDNASHGRPDFDRISKTHLLISSNAVIRLARVSPRNMSYSLYFNNYYTSNPLLEYLAKQGIYNLGTAQSNRFQTVNYLTRRN